MKQIKRSKLKFYGNRGNFGEEKSIIILVTEDLLLEMGSSSHNRLRCFPLTCVTLPVLHRPAEMAGVIHKHILMSALSMSQRSEYYFITYKRCIRRGDDSTNWR